MIGLLLLTVLALAYANGANDNFKATATIYGSETLGYRGALALATVAQVLGSVASVFVAARPYQSECAAGGRYGALETALAYRRFARSPI